MAFPAVVAAGDRGAARAVRGESKVFLELGGRPLVAWVVASLQRVPEVSEVWVVGDAKRLHPLFERDDLRRELVKPLHIQEQFGNLYENLWESYRRVLPEAGSEGRDPVEGEGDLDLPVLYLSGDLPFATPQEISQFVQRSLEIDCDYALGLVTEEAMQGFLPSAPGEPGIRMASFNLREGRFRQSNLHFVKPGRLGNRALIQKLYEARHQRELGDVIRLLWGLLRDERGGFTALYYVLLMHLAGLADRRGLRRLADVIRRWIPLARMEKGCSNLLGTRFRFVATDVGGCAIDIDTEPDYAASLTRFEEWRAAQAALAERLVGPLPLPPRAGGDEGAG